MTKETGRSGAEGSGEAGESGRQTGEDAIALLEADHRKVEGLFKAYKSATDHETKTELIQQICAELVIHTLIEEEIFYPACREAMKEEVEPLNEAQVEHDSAKILIADLMRRDLKDPYRDAKVAVLAGQIRFHIGEEEKPREGIFAKAQAAGIVNRDLARALRDRKQALLARAEKLDGPSRPVCLRPSRFAHRPEGGRGGRGNGQVRLGHKPR